MKKIKEGVIEAGKTVESSRKDLIDKLPRLTQRENNFDRLYKELTQLIVDSSELEENKIKDAKDKIRVTKMLRSKEQLAAIKGLISDGVIKNFSEDNMSRLLEKGLSTHEEDDMQKLLDLMKDFQPAIMASGNNKIEKVEKIVDDKVKEMKPNSHLYQLSLLASQIGDIAELFNCGAGKRSNKFAQSTLKQSNCIVYFIAQNVLFYI